MRRDILLGLLLFFQVVCEAGGQTGTGDSRFDNLIFKVAVFGGSDDIFIWWGHAALIVETRPWGYARIFDWGVFSYPSDNFLLDFINNRVRYKSAVGPLDYDINLYTAEDRDITLYTLDLDREGKEAILAYAENDVLPENCYYQYHQFRNNCATRIRDILDKGTAGQFRRRFEGSSGRFTLRQHVRRFTWSRPAADWFLDLLMGETLDEPISQWEEMFLPLEIGRDIVDFRYTDHAGVERKLVDSVEVLNASKNRPPVLQAPLRTWPRDLILGLGLAWLFLLMGRLRKRFPRTGRILWGIGQSLLGLLLGAAGIILFYGQFCISEDYIRRNYSVFFINPLLLVLVPLGIGTALNRPRQLSLPLPCRLARYLPASISPNQGLRFLWTYVFIAALFTVIIKALPFFYQQNQSIRCLILPMAALQSGLLAKLNRHWEP